MSIQSLNGRAGPAPQPTQGRGSPPPAVDATPASGAPPVQPSAQATPKQIEQALEKLKVAMASKASALQFSLDDQTGQTIVRVVDSETGDVIRQIPSKELLEIAHALDKMQGMLLKQSA